MIYTRDDSFAVMNAKTPDITINPFRIFSPDFVAVELQPDAFEPLCEHSTTDATRHTQKERKLRHRGDEVSKICFLSVLSGRG